MKKYEKFKSVALSLILVFVGCVGCGNKPNTAIETVKNGHLGEYTDMTVAEALDGYYSLIYENIEWDGGTADSGKTIVQVKYTADYSDPTTIQFTMLDEERFKVTAMSTPDRSTSKANDIAALLNFAYYQQTVLKNKYILESYDTELAFIEALNSVSGSAVLYGASHDYDGNRTQICKLFGDSLIDLGVAWMLDSYGLLDMGYYVTGGGQQETESEPLDDFGWSTDTIRFDTEFYSLTLPAYWADLCVYSQWDIQPYSYGITFYEQQSYNDFNGEGGELFSLALHGNDEYYDFPDYTYLGELCVIRLANYDIIVTYPTDIEFSEAGQDNYLRLKEDIPDILASFAPQPDIDCEYSSAIQ